jgi:Lon protease-like protein
METLPTILPVFRVMATVLMPRAQLPIMVPEGDYSCIATEAIENNIVAVIQPKPNFVKGTENEELNKSFNIGCAGKITDVSFLYGEVAINIYGLCRFETIDEFPVDNSGIERVAVSYKKFLIDMESTDTSIELDKERLLNALDLYFKNLEISPNWQEIEKTPVDTLVSALAMACPFNPSEKQSLLETVAIKDRSDMITRIIEMNSFDRYNTANTVN